MHPLSLVTKKGSSFVYESSHYVRVRASIGYTRYEESALRDIVRFWCIFFSLHVPRSCDHFYIHCILLSIYMYIYIWCMFFTLSHVCCFFSLFIHMFLLLYNLSIFHTWCLDESCLSVLIKIGCKSTMLWSLFLQSFSRVRSKVRLMYFCNLWESCVRLLS